MKVSWHEIILSVFCSLFFLLAFEARETGFKEGQIEALKGNFLYEKVGEEYILKRGIRLDG